MTELALMYERGKGVDVDEKEALRWHGAGSEAGDAMATARALALYQDSKTLKKDDDDIEKLQATLKKQAGDDAEDLVLLASLQHGATDRKAPNAKGTIGGKAFKLSDHKGKVVVLKFGATWCGHCKAMLPHQEKMLKRLKDEPFVILDVDTDQNADLAEQWDVTSVPTIYVIDHQGVIRATDVRGEALDKAVDKLLAAMKEKK